MYIELHCHTAYSFLDGASDVDDLVHEAARIGMPALAMTDHNSLTAAIKFRDACRSYHVAPIFGAELTMDDGTHLTLLAKSATGYAHIGQALSLAYTLGGRLSPALPWERLPEFAEDVICLSGCTRGKIRKLVHEHRFADALAAARRLKDWFGGDLYVELQDDLSPHASSICRLLAHLARRIDAPCVATNDVHYAAADGMIVHDIKRCIAAGITIAEPHPTRPLNAERRIKSTLEMSALFDWIPEAIDNTERIAALCARGDILPQGELITPAYPLPDGITSSQHLREIAYLGAARRHGRITPPVRERLEDELMLLSNLGYSDFVLHAARIVDWARSQGIRVTGRGSGADSEVCYCLGLTDIDVIERNLPLARWVAPGKKPDIDIDFDARRRDDVFRWVSSTYGADKVALCCTYATYWAKGAIRDIGKTLALPPKALAWFSKHVTGFTSAGDLSAAFLKNAELKEYGAVADRFEALFDLCRRIAGHPRHLGSHSSGLVISGAPLWTVGVLTPSARGVLPIVMLDKDDVEEAGAVKLDILSLPILSVVGDAANNIRESDPDFDYDAIPREDKNVYRMLWTGANMGLFQLGSPAQANLATMLHPRDFEDLVASIGLIRPGPIKARAVQKYVSARNGYRRIEYPHPALVPILERTYGVVCFQEQVTLIIGAMMGMSDAEAEVWRKRLAKHARAGTMAQARDEFVARACRRHRDLSPKTAHLMMDELEGWSSLGFVEGHSASFALTGQKSAHLAYYHPAEYYAAILSNQPCGFYPPQSIGAEARRRGIPLRPVDINESVVASVACDDEYGGQSIRLGFSLVAGMREPDMRTLLDTRAERPFRSLLDFCLRVTIPRDAIENLILCGAFDQLHEHRRGLLWRLNETLAKAGALRAEQANTGRRLDLRFVGEQDTPVAWEIADLSDWEKMMGEWRVTGVTSSCHPFAHLRSALERQGIITAYEAMQRKAGAQVRVAGLNIRPHRPPAKSGGRHLFTTIEDESAYLQVAFYNAAIETNMATILLSPIVVLTGTIRRRGMGASLEARTAAPLPMSRTARLAAGDLLTEPPRRTSAAR
ncbi:MAG: DNA polymerase III subunit alpha [Capsulimonadaceae bacterium]|nr:DNA polymerase III subunit alpha [Capsulimonadaceae bacterium]